MRVGERAERLEAARAFAGVARVTDRGLVEVGGGDRERWLNGMISNDVAALGPETTGCYATLLTPKGRIVADLHVGWREDCFWLETARHAIALVIERLDRYVIADDVTLRDRSDEFDVVALEGGGAAALLAKLGADAPLEREAWRSAALAGQALEIAAFGWIPGQSFRLFAPAGAGQSLVDALCDADERAVRLDAEDLEVLRIESGVPRLGPDLDEEVFPDEARLDRAISSTKGCYTGQEIVARLRSRGHVNHILVGLRFEGDAAAAEAALFVGGKRSGEVTSVCTSPTLGAIGLGYVRVEHADPDTELELAGSAARVVALPFIGAGPEVAT